MKLIMVQMHIAIGSICPYCKDLKQHSDQLHLFYWCGNCKRWFYAHSKGG